MSQSAYYQQSMPPGNGTQSYPVHHQSYASQPLHHQQPYQQHQSQQQHQSGPTPEVFLSEAFPNIDRATIGAILASTRGDIDPAYNALLAISGQTTSDEQNPPALPPRPSRSPMPRPSSENIRLPSQSYQAAISPAPAYQTSYLTPALSRPDHQSAASSPQLRPHSGSITPLYAPASPNLYPSGSVPPQYSDSQPIESRMPDMRKLSLSEQTPPKIQQHWAHCDGCKADPIITNRWKCVACADYDLCDECKDAGIHSQHRFERMPEAMEIHDQIYCDGCNDPGEAITGVRYQCLKHDDEDYCTQCIQSGKACGGPYEEIKQTELGRQVELEGCVPMPERWKPYLRPAIATYNVCVDESACSWFDQPQSFLWYDTPGRNRKRTMEPKYKIEFKISKGHFMSDHRYSWIMKQEDGTKLFSYLLENDRKTNVIKTEQFSEYKGSDNITPVFKHGSDADSLTFKDPHTGTLYRWVSNRPISNINDERWDFQRYALFQRHGQKEVIVADHTWWDGAPKNPEDCLSIRDPKIDHAMVLASFEIMRGHQWALIREEKEKNLANFEKTESKARLTRYGRCYHWYSVGSAKGSSADKLQVTSSFLKSVNNGIKVANMAMHVANTVNGINGGNMTVAATGGGGGGCGGGGGGC